MIINKNFYRVFYKFIKNEWHFEYFQFQFSLPPQQHEVMSVNCSFFINMPLVWEFPTVSDTTAIAVSFISSVCHMLHNSPKTQIPVSCEVGHSVKSRVQPHLSVSHNGKHRFLMQT